MAVPFPAHVQTWDMLRKCKDFQVFRNYPLLLSELLVAGLRTERAVSASRKSIQGWTAVDRNPCFACFTRFL